MAVVINGSAGVTTNSGAVYNGIASGTAVASTSGTSIDFTSIPSWVKRITVMFNGVSKSSTANFLIQLGAGSVETTGYVGNAVAVISTVAIVNVSSTAGFPTAGDAAGVSVIYGSLVLTLLGSNAWTASGVITLGNGGYNTTMAGSKTLSGTLDRVRITTTSGTDTFDAGSINILYE